MHAPTRRGFLAMSCGAGLSPWLATSATHAALLDDAPTAPDGFPRQPLQAVQSVVGAAHGNFDRVRELVDATPELAKASWDWGFGDWESALGAASHTGRREIALYLIAHGARPNVFTYAMLGALDVVKAAIALQPEVVRLRGPHGISLLRHARAGGDAARPVAEYLSALGDPDSTALVLDDPAPYLGRYQTAGSPPWQFDVHLNGTALALTVNDGTARNLMMTAPHRFHPAGADSVQVAFEVIGPRAERMTLTVGSRVYPASRSA